MKYLVVATLFILSLTSCDIKPEPISYNHDECAYCKMKISDVRFGAEMVTSKGKIYKYDSAECLVRTYIENNNPDYKFVIVTDYARPHTLIDASTTTYLISENQPSPMGGNLSAYEHKNHGEMAMDEKSGKLITFQELLDEYRSIYQ